MVKYPKNKVAVPDTALLRLATAAALPEPCATAACVMRRAASSAFCASAAPVRIMFA